MTRHPTLLRIGQILIVGWVALLPLQTRLFLHRGMLGGELWEYGTLSVYLTDVVLLLAAAIFLWVERRAFWRVPQGVPRVLVGAALAVVSVTAVSIFVAQDVGISVAAWLRIALGMVAWWLVVKSRVRLITFAVTVIASAGVEAVLAILQSAQQMVPASTLFGLAAHAPSVAGDAVIETTAGRFLRAHGTFPHPNMLASWFVIASVLATGLYLRSKDWLERSVLLTILLLLQAGLFLTFSRAGIIVWWCIALLLLAATLLREWHVHRRHFPWSLVHHRASWLSAKMLKLTLASFFLLGLLSVVLAPLLSVRAGFTGRLEVRSVEERATQFREAKILFTRHWLFGTGIGNYTKALSQQEAAQQQPAWAYQPVHLALGVALIELGVLGWIVVLWAIALVAVVAVRTHQEHWKQEQPHDIPWSAVAGTALLAIFLLSLADHSLWTLHFGVLMTWLVLGMWTKSLQEV